jgi:hypothetical protein
MDHALFANLLEQNPAFKKQGHSVWDLWWKNVALQQFFFLSEYFGRSLIRNFFVNAPYLFTHSLIN